MRTKLLVSYLLIIFFSSILIAGDVISIKSILDNPQKFDGKIVTIQGEVVKLKSKVSKKGNPYFTFKLDDGEANITVFSFGKSNIENDDKVKVTGIFNAVKRVGKYTFYNEIDATGGIIKEIK